MAEISFGGLATGMDTTALVEGLMAVERRPMDLLEAGKAKEEEKRAAALELDGYLQALKDKIRGLNETADVRSTKASLSSLQYFTADSTSGSPGSYQVQVAQLAQLQKTVSQNGYDSINTPYFGSGVITIDGYDITIDDDNNGLAGIRDAINATSDTHGVTATIIDNGETSDNFRLVLTGKDASTAFDFSSTLTDAIGDPISFDDDIVQNAQQAEIYVDSIKVVSDTNTVTGAIDGVTLNLLQVSPLQDSGDPTSWTPVSMTVSSNADETVSRLEDLVSAYNDVMTFIGQQSRSEDNPEGGVLLGDPAMNGIKRQLQSMISSQSTAGGSVASLSVLGFATQKDGTLQFNTDELRNVLSADLEGVELLLVGSDGKSGIINQMEDFLADATSVVDGFYKTKSSSITSMVESINSQIEMMQMRLDKREDMLYSKFTAMELLVSTMNAQSDFLTQQLESLSNMTSKK